MIQRPASWSHPGTAVPARAPIPVIGFVGASGSGKTTLITRVLPLLANVGRRVAVLKHARHGFDIDRPGKDSYRAREAGAAQVLVASRNRWALLTETPSDASEPDFLDLLSRFNPLEIDLVLAEGFASEPYPKIEVYRPSHGQPPKCWPRDPDVCAVACDELVAVSVPVIHLDLNRPDLVAHYLLTASPVAFRPPAAIHAD